MKKILILTNNSGGLYSFRNELVTELKKTCDVAAATPFDGHISDLKALGCRLIQTEFNRRGLNPAKDWALFRRYRQIIQEGKPDFVITYTIKPNLYGSIACRLAKIPYAVNITGLGTAFEKPGLLRTGVIRTYRYALKKAKVVFFENSHNRDLFIREKMAREEQCCLLNGAGVNLERYAIQPYPRNPVFRFLFIGRIMKEKGIEELFEAVQRLYAEGQSCILDVLGGFDEDYSSAIKTHEAEGWLHYHGVQQDVRPFYGQCDCFVLPSWHEGMANTNLEAAASGRPVITSDIPGCREAVHAGESGLLCRPKDIESLYQTMKTMIGFPTEKRKAMGLAGRKRMEDQFDKQSVVKQTIDRIQ